jgi:hypothetical protein
MRLTLRTLLAWLDDTLQPTQVREIGSQVAGSPFAQELSDRIHRVTRQRRLSVPSSSSGPEATDPNIVACYLDNELDPEAVAEYEKKCLTSDVNLAEVASVHQILSLLGQKVKVPSEARWRMYQLVKGREAHRPKKPVARRTEAAEPVTKPIQHWVVPEAPRRPWIERFGPGVLCLLLIGLTSVTAWRSLTTPAPEPFRTPHPAENIADGKPVASSEPRDNATRPDAPAIDPTVVAGAAAGAEAAVGQPQPGTNDSAKAASKLEEMDAAKVAAGSDSAPKTKDAAAPPVAPVGSVGLAAAPDGILLRYNDAERVWESLKTPAPVATSNRILCLAPFRATITMGKTEIVLVGETELRILPQSADGTPTVDLVQGRLLVRQQPAGSLRLAMADHFVTVGQEANDDVAIERTSRWEYGRIINPAPKLVIYCMKGEISVSVDKNKQSLGTLDSLSVDAAGGIKQATEEALPAWAGDTVPSPHDLQIREQFAHVFHPGRPVLAEIVTACEDQSPEIKLLSIQALKSLGDMSLLVPNLSRKDDPLVRRATLTAIRSYMGMSSEAAARVRDQLAEEFGEDTASIVGKMLMGFSAQEASSPQVFEQLVGLLSPEQESLGVRELALDTLKRLTGRDDLGYDPDHAEGKGLTAWKDLQRQGKLRVTAPRPKAQ